MTKLKIHNQFEWRQRIFTLRDLHSVHGSGEFSRRHLMEIIEDIGRKAIAQKGLTNLKGNFLNPCATQSVIIDVVLHIQKILLPYCS